MFLPQSVDICSRFKPCLETRFAFTNDIMMLKAWWKFKSSNKRITFLNSNFQNKPAKLRDAIAISNLKLSMTDTLTGVGATPPSGSQTYVFDRFLQLGGSKWAEIVLYEQGVPLRRSGHPTCLYSYQNKIRPTMGPQN